MSGHVCIIWYDTQLINNNSTTGVNNYEVKILEQMLTEATELFDIVSSEEECIDRFCKKSERIILVISKSSASEKLLEKAQLVRQVDTIFMFSFNENGDDQQNLDSSNFTKVVRTFYSYEPLKYAIFQLVDEIQKQSFLLSFYDPSKQKSIRNLESDAGSFIWLQIIKEVIQKMASTNDSDCKKEMLSRCRTLYRDNQKELQNIDEFERNYSCDQALNWYTRDTFIFKVINRALRTEDVESLYIYRYFIVDLCAQIMDQWMFWKDCWNPNYELKLFRGVKQSDAEIERLKCSIDQLICTNSFFSTSRNIEVAKIYGGFDKPSSNMNSVLFEIFISDISNCIVADISPYSRYGDEEEVLFDLGTVFEISEFAQVDDTRWICRLKPSAKGYDIAKCYTDLKRKEMN